MKRRSFITALAGMPIVGFGSRLFGQPTPAEKSGITVHGPELIVVKRWWPANDKGTLITLPAGYIAGRSIGGRTLSLRFENVPLQGERMRRGLVDRLQSIGGIVNRSDWYWFGEFEHSPAGLSVEPARTMMFTDFCVGLEKHGLCCVVCAFTQALRNGHPWPTRPGYARNPTIHRPVDFETEILKALTVGKS